MTEITKMRLYVKRITEINKIKKMGIKYSNDGVIWRDKTILQSYIESDGYEDLVIQVPKRSRYFSIEFEKTFPNNTFFIKLKIFGCSLDQKSVFFFKNFYF